MGSSRSSLGSSLSAGQKEFAKTLYYLLKKNGQEVSEKEVKGLVKTIFEICPWMPQTGSDKLDDWYKVGNCLRDYPCVPSKVLFIWGKVCACIVNQTPAKNISAQLPRDDGQSLPVPEALVDSLGQTENANSVSTYDSAFRDTEPWSPDLKAAAAESVPEKGNSQIGACAGDGIPAMEKWQQKAWEQAVTNDDTFLTQQMKGETFAKAATTESVLQRAVTRAAVGPPLSVSLDVLVGEETFTNVAANFPFSNSPVSVNFAMLVGEEKMATSEREAVVTELATIIKDIDSPSAQKQLRKLLAFQNPNGGAALAPSCGSPDNDIQSVLRVCQIVVCQPQGESLNCFQGFEKVRLLAAAKKTIQTLAVGVG